uniref:ERF1_1 domain-containing protein n=1 Tax=Panagrellus redivivus TaxID=6233 RepID=A0A7E4ZUQ0_PANRE
MKILERLLEENGSGFVKLLCVTQDDLWDMLNIVRKGDRIEALTCRKIKEKVHKLRRITSVKVPCELEILVNSVEFDPIYKGIRFQGFTTSTTEYVDKGWAHTLDIKLNQPFKLTKKCWLPMDTQRIESSLEVRQEDSLAAVVLHEGVAQIYIVQRNMTSVKATVNMQVARKRSGFGSGREKSIQEFLETAAKSFMRHINVNDQKTIVVAGRGFIHNNFLETLLNVADQMDQPFSKMQKEKFVLVSVSSGYKHSLKEILNNPATADALAHTTAKEDSKTLEKFMGMVMEEPSRAFYGYKHVAMANEHVAIDTLLISDALIRSDNVHERKKYIAIVDDVKLNNGKVMVFSSLHPSGEQLNMMTGIAAILRYPLMELEDEEMDDNEEKHTGLEILLRTDDTYNADECVCPRKYYSKQEEEEKSHYKHRYAKYTLSASEMVEEWEKLVEADVSFYFDEEKKELDHEQPAPRLRMTLGDCIIKKR